MLELLEVNLCTDAAAAPYIKDETVRVEFASQAGRLKSSVGGNVYQAGDALITGVDGDRWSVSRERFDAGYEALLPTLPGQPGDYRNRPRAVLARQMSTAFRCRRRAGGDWLQGEAGDWLLQYAPGDHGIVTRARFARVYKRAGSAA